jgi:hypothetical protein
MCVLFNNSVPASSVTADVKNKTHFITITQPRLLTVRIKELFFEKGIQFMKELFRRHVRVNERLHRWYT